MASVPSEGGEGPGLTIFDGSGRLRGAFAVVPDGNVWLTLSDKEGNQRAALVVRPDGSPWVGVYDREGKPM